MQTLTTIRHLNLIAALFFGLAIVFGIPARAADELNLDRAGQAVKGYDVVALFDDKVLKGSTHYSALHQGAKYRFSSQNNLERFRANPASYAPQYGGYCAYGVRIGQKLDIDPTAYYVQKKKLYLLLNHGTKLIWSQNRQDNITIANTIWPKLQSIPFKTSKK